MVCVCGCAPHAYMLIHVHPNAIINYCIQHVLVFTNSAIPGLLCLMTHWRLTSVELCVRANHSLIMIIIFIIKNDKRLMSSACVCSAHNPHAMMICDIWCICIGTAPCRQWLSWLSCGHHWSAQILLLNVWSGLWNELVIQFSSA